MKHMITEEHGGGTFGSFLAVESNGPVPLLANAADPYTCEEISVDRYGMKKHMYWCKRTRYAKYESDETGHVDGFFISGSRRRIDRAFIFIPSPTNRDKVSPFAKMERISFLSRYALRCDVRRMEVSSSSSWSN